MGSYGAVGTPPHGLELELFDTSLIRGDRCTFDADLVFEDRMGRIHSHLVVCLEAALEQHHVI
jgi:hypothetical protein